MLLMTRSSATLTSSSSAPPGITGGKDRDARCVDQTRIVRFTANGNVAAEADGIGDPIFDLGVSTKHNGGHIHFGNDGKLYIPVGDNKRDRFEPILDTMKLNNLFGKVLRINADGTIPANNPFVDVPMAITRPSMPGAFATPSASRSSPPRGTKSTSTTWASRRGKR
jgi:glucose/arabinose dehydrogenase